MSVVLVIDDEPIVRDLMVEILDEAGYETAGAETAERGLDLLEDERVSLVVSDIHMPGLSGLELLEEVRIRRPSLPVVLVTGAGTYSNLTEALSRGADGFVMKPFSHAELERAVVAALDRAGRSERELKERLLTPTLASTLANAIEARDLGMDGHCERLAALASLLAVRLGLPPGDVETVRLGAILHDIGKICIPDRVLLKPGPLDEVEQALVRTHPIVGDRLLEPLDLVASVRPVVRHHHERWDGGGYPDGLAGEDIPLTARIVAVADAVEAMSARRPYRQPLDRDAVLRELDAGRGRQWDPVLINLVAGFVAAGEVAFDTDGLRVTNTELSRETRVVPTVLLVEDDRDHATLAAMAIQATLGDVRVVLAAAGEEALAICAGSTWSVAVLDERLHAGSGIDVLEALRKADPDLPVVMLSGADSQSVALEAYRRGATDYIVKSGDYLEVLSRRIRELLRAA